MVILVDTNVVLDFLTMRQPYYDAAKKIIRMCAEGQTEGYLAFHSLPNIFYILRRDTMPVTVNALLGLYVEELKKIYGERLKSVILYGSCARGDFRPDSDIDIMILVDLADAEIDKYSRQLSWFTYDFNEEHAVDIKPIAKGDAHFKKWLGVYPFYTNVQKEGVELYGTA